MKPDYRQLWKIVGQVLLVIILIFISLNIFGAFFIEKLSQSLFVDDSAGESLETIKEKAPYFELQNTNGKLIKLTDLRDVPSVIMFWSSWNENSSGELKILDRISKEKGDLFKMLAINSQEERGMVIRYLEREAVAGLEVLLDVNGGVGDLYGARNLPAFYFIDKEGFLVDSHYGFLSEDQIVEKIAKFSN